MAFGREVDGTKPVWPVQSWARIIGIGLLGYSHLSHNKYCIKYVFFLEMGLTNC